MKPYRLFLSTLTALAFTVSTLCAGTLHVSAKGDDANDGSSPAKAFRTLQKAADRAEPGDTVLVGDGTYLDEGDTKATGSALVKLTKHNRADAWITFKAAPGARPVLRPKGWGGIAISGSYYIIDGLTVTGFNDSINLIDALKEAENARPDPYYNTNGIVIEGRQNAPDKKPHHIIVRNCTVSKMPGGGLTALEADYFTFEDNLIFENAWFMRYGGSGITTLNCWAHDDKPGYHVIIQRNFVWDNKTLVPWSAIGRLSDGNGILMDVTDGIHHAATVQNADAAANPNVTNETPAAAAPAATAAPTAARRPNPNAASLNPLRPKWVNRTLIANNLSAFNGGSGIHTFRSRHVDIINNTTYWNGSVVGYQELFPNRSVDIKILNNIIVPRPGGRITSNSRNEQIVWDYNLYPTAQSVFKGPNDIVADPMFIKISRDFLEADFRLKKKSPALHSGTDDTAQLTDLNGKKRPAGKARDRGVYEQ